MAAKEVSVNVYGVFFTPEEQRERSTWHETTYLECEIPEALEKELSDLIDQKVKEFEEKCKCGLCQLHKRD